MIDETRMGELFEQHYNDIYRFCLVHLKNPTDAEDAAMDVFSLLIEKGDGLEDEHISAWLYKVAFFVLQNIKRCEQVRSKYVSFSGDTVVFSKNLYSELDCNFILALEDLTDAEIVAEKERILNALSERERRLYNDIYVEKKKYEEIAAQLGTSVNNIGIRSYRLRKKIKELVKASPKLFSLFVGFFV